MFNILDLIMYEFAKNDDYLTGIFAHADKKKTDKLDVPTRLNGDKIEWQPDLLKGMVDGQREVQFAGELVHLALGHPERMKQMTGGISELWTLAEMAMMLSTYHMLEHDNRLVPPEVFLRPEQFQDKDGNPFPKNESAEKYFQLLVDLFNSKNKPIPMPGEGQGDQQQQQGQGQGEGEGEGEQQGQGEGEGEDQQDGKDQGQGQQGQGKDPVRQALDSLGIKMPKYQPQDMSKWGNVPKTTQEMAKILLKEALQKYRGTLPAGWKRVLEQLETPEEDDWKRLVDRMIGSKFAIRKFRRTMKRPSRRFGVGWPGKKRIHRGTLVQAIDSSGSMGDTELAVIVSKGKQLARRYGAPYLAIVCDAAIHTIKMVRKVVDLDELEILGGGGTSSLPVFKYLEDNKIRTDLLVYFTDLEIDFPQNKPAIVRDMVWAVVNNPSRNEVPFGEILHVEIKEK